jgi:hypothetical protein
MTTMTYLPKAKRQTDLVKESKPTKHLPTPGSLKNGKADEMNVGKSKLIKEKSNKSKTEHFIVFFHILQNIPK